MTQRPYTHAGGLVVRRTQRGFEALLVRPSDGTDAWVLPKGHIESGESTQTAALREVREEAGVEARIDSLLGSSSFRAKAEHVHAAYFLMFWERDVHAEEERERRWVPLAEAAEWLTYEDAKELAIRSIGAVAGHN